MLEQRFWKGCCRSEHAGFWTGRSPRKFVGRQRAAPRRGEAALPGMCGAGGCGAQRLPLRCPLGPRWPGLHCRREIDPNSLEIMEKLGEGEFGVVHKAKW